VLTAAAGLCRNQDVAAAAHGAVASAVDALGRPPHTVVTFTSARYADPRPVVAAARKAARGARVVGCAAQGVIAGAREHEDETAAACLALGGDASVSPFLTVEPASLARDPGERGLGLLFADGYSHHPDDLADALGTALPGYRLAGGLASGPEGLYPAHRWLDGEVSAAGTAGLLLAGVEPTVAVTRGLRALGPVHRVTAARGQVIATLDGRPAFEVFAERARPLLDDLPRAAQSVFVAVGEPGDERDPIEEHYALRGLLRFDPERGLLAVSEAVPEGTRVRFAMREPHAARQDLVRTVAAVSRQCAAPRFGFYFCCAGRGRGLFGVDDHDVAYIHAHLGAFPLVGFFGGGEIGPGRPGRPSRMHLFAGVLALVP
jgi:small ligand-binding sensory domain FIST